MRLYEICGAIENCFDEETGEITVDLDALELAKEEKVDNIACLYKSIVAESDAIKNEEQKLRQRRRVLENKADGLKSYLSNCLNGEKIITPRCSVSFRKSESVDVPDITKLPKKYRVIEEKADKVAIKKEIKAGKTVKGAELVERVNIVIS